MGTPYISEIKLISFNFAPRGWAFCSGQIMSIQQNQALFALIGTFYGGNGTSNFALPNLQGRVPIHMSSDFFIGQAGGEESHTLTASEIPQHTHPVNAVPNGTTGGTNVPSSSVELGSASTSQNPPQVSNLYSTSGPTTSLASGTVGNTGGNQPHENRMPFLVLNYAIALQGIFPSRN